MALFFESMVVFPHCKINLGLNVVGRRADGYHDLVTCFYPVGWEDVLEVVPSTSFALHQHGQIIPGAETDNLVVKAWRLLKEAFDIDPVEIHLLKHIPVGAGLGGGSSDGAFTLRALNDLFSLNLTTEQLAVYAGKLGSDCAFFVYDKPMIGTGRGERLEAVNVNLRGMHLAIVKPEIHISTADAFKMITPRKPEADIRSIVEGYPVSAWKDLLVNDFTSVVFGRYPLLSAISERLYACGALYVSLTGSGSAVYGIFDAEVELSEEFREYTYWFGALN